MDERISECLHHCADKLRGKANDLDKIACKEDLSDTDALRVGLMIVREAFGQALQSMEDAVLWIGIAKREAKP